MIKKEFISTLLVLLALFLAKGALGQCIVNVTVDGGPVIRVKESDRLLSVTLKRAGNTTIEAKVNVSTEEKTAKAGTDFISIPPYQAVRFAPDSDNAVVNITIVNDNQMEDLIKTFFLNLTSNDANVCAPLPSATIEIEDEDIVVVGFQDPSKTFSESHGTFSLKFFKEKDKTKLPITVSYSTPGLGTAAINIDYKNISGTMTFDESQYSKNLSNVATIIDNNIVEDKKCFYITLAANNKRVVLKPQQSEICITNDDKAIIEFTSNNYTAAEKGKKASVDIVKIGKTAIPLKVKFNMVRRNFETAESGKDYTNRHGSEITIPKSLDNTIMSEWFEIKDDAEAESVEVFAVGLEAVDPSTTTIGPKNLAVVRITDNQDQEFQATTQKEKEDEQKKRTHLLTILMIAALALIFVIIVAIFIVACLIKRRMK